MIVYEMGNEWNEKNGIVILGKQKFPFVILSLGIKEAHWRHQLLIQKSARKSEGVYIYNICIYNYIYTYIHTYILIDR